MRWFNVMMLGFNIALMGLNMHTVQKNREIAENFAAIERNYATIDRLKREEMENLPPHACGSVIMPGERCTVVQKFTLPRKEVPGL